MGYTFKSYMYSDVISCSVLQEIISQVLYVYILVICNLVKIIDKIYSKKQYILNPTLL